MIGISSNANTLDEWIEAIIPHNEKDQKALKWRMAGVSIRSSLWARPMSRALGSSRFTSVMTATDAFDAIRRKMN